MGFLKKITKPISKALDKLVPNEIKPFLPYVAAVAPMIYSGGLGGTNVFSTNVKKSCFIRRIKFRSSISSRRK
jgi:hypothetical protein